MYVENIVFDAVDPQLLGRFWEAAVGGEVLTDEPDIFETRLHSDGGPTLDLCFQRVPEKPKEPLRLHLDLFGGTGQAETVERLIGLGARHLDIGQGSVPWVVLSDVEGNPFCVIEKRAAYSETGPIVAIPIDAADPRRDVSFWSWLTGWGSVDAVVPQSLRHPSRRGPFLEFCLESQSAGTEKNRMHLDIRLEPSDDPDLVAAEISERGGSELHPGWGDLPWRVYRDPSGNEFCVLPARS